MIPVTVSKNTLLFETWKQANFLHMLAITVQTRGGIAKAPVAM